jgi:hypothetical protein
MVKGEVRGGSPSLGLEHDGCVGCGDPPQQLELLVGQRAAGRIVPELETLTVDLADAVRQLKPDVAWKGSQARIFARSGESSSSAARLGGRRTQLIAQSGEGCDRPRNNSPGYDIRLERMPSTNAKAASVVPRSISSNCPWAALSRNVENPFARRGCAPLSTPAS